MTEDGQPMVMAEETFLASILFSIPVVWMFLKMGVNHSDPQPPQPPQGQPYHSIRNTHSIEKAT